MANSNLRQAKMAKNDEFYTQLSDIENELRHYRGHFEGKTILCNCDDPFESNFFKYFALNFEFLKLKKLIAVAYADSPIVKERLCNSGHGYVAEMTFATDVNGDTAFDWDDIMEMLHNGSIKITDLAGKGDFRDDECLKLLDEADIVVTNPPFSLFREYVATLVEHEKKFIVWGNMNAVTYKEIFPLLKNNEMWLGFMANKTCLFRLPDSYVRWDEKKTKEKNDGHHYGNVPSIATFTNLDISKRHENLILFKRYCEDPSFYPKYDNYDAINVDKVKYIPEDYDGVMGVPITFINNYNPEQFEIVGIAKRGAGDPALKTKVYTKQDYDNCSDLNAGPVLITNGVPKNTYPRILIRNLHPLIPQS